MDWDLQKFTHVGRFDDKATPADIAKKADTVGTKLVELKAYITADQSAKS